MIAKALKLGTSCNFLRNIFTVFRSLINMRLCKHFYYNKVYFLIRIYARKSFQAENDNDNGKKDMRKLIT